MHSFISELQAVPVTCSSTEFQEPIESYFTISDESFVFLFHSSGV